MQQNKVTKEAEILQEGFSLIFCRVKLLPDSNKNDYELDDEKESAIEVSAPDDGTDYVLIVKDSGVMVANVYIRSGDTYELHLPNGEYEVYFYGGKRWNPKKRIGERVGAFEQGDFMKDDEEVALQDGKMVYSLEQTEDGNFEGTSCDEEDALD